MRRFEKTDFLYLSESDEILLQIQQARFDKKNAGSGLSIQESAEFMSISQYLQEQIEKQKSNVPEFQNVVDKWFSFKDDENLEDHLVVEKFDSFICDLMDKFKLK